MSQLTTENFTRGFLVDTEWMGGVSEHPEKSGFYVAFVMNHQTGEYVGYHEYPELSPAIESLNTLKRSWNFEKSSGCGSGQCGSDCGTGACGTSACPKGLCET